MTSQMRKLGVCFLLSILTSIAALNSAAVTYYVNASNPAPVAPYTDWSTAATNIQDAVSAAAAGDLILVTNGVYQYGGQVVYGALTNRVAVTKPLTLQSVNGPGVTTILGYQVAGSINGDAAVRCVYLTNGAALTGFMLTNGATRSTGDAFEERSGGGIWCESSNAVVSNCVIAGNSSSALQDQSGGGGAYQGTFNNCTFTGNSANNGGGVNGGVLNNCTLANNSANNNFGGGAYQATLNNCILSSNSAFAFGGGAADSTLNNCLVTGNQANGDQDISQGGGVYSSTLNNCTLTGNSSLNLGSGAFGSTLNNCIAYDNAYFDNSFHSTAQDNYYGCTMNYCCTTPLPSGPGNFTNAPNFVNFTPFVNQPGGNFRLQTNSPCIDAGSNGYVVGTTDLDGNPRISNGTVDVGAYEFQYPGTGPPPTITIQPQSQSVVVGNPVSFSVLATGIGPSSYQWQFNGLPLSGATNTTLSIASAQVTNAGSYLVVVSDFYGSVSSSNAVLTVLTPPPTLYVQPQSQSVVVGNPVSFTGLATGLGPISYQWEFNGTPVTGATNPTLSVASAQVTNAGTYAVIVSNPYNSDSSSNAALTVTTPPPTLTSQPSSQSVVPGTPVSLTASATGGLPLFYQWQMNGSPIPGATNTALNFESVQLTDGGAYVVVVSNAYGSATSSNALLIVLTPTAIRYVNVNNSVPSAPYTDWSTAATNIQDAVDAAAPGDLILVTNGLYQVGGRVVLGTITNRLAVTQPMVVQSVNGPSVTAISGIYSPYYQVRCAYLTNGVLLGGFTLTNGIATGTGDPVRDRWGGGVWCQSDSVVVSNCVLTWNSAENLGGGAYQGTLKSCILSRNFAAVGGGAAGGTLNNCILTGNVASQTGGAFPNAEGGGAYNATLNNCSLISNSAASSGGGAYGGTLNNCIVISNSINPFGAHVYSGGGVAGATLNNCLVIGNSVLGGINDYGGGAYQSTLNNCTVTGNTVDYRGSGTYFCTLNNCIVYFNNASYGNYDSSSMMNYCCTIPLPSGGVGNFTSAPLFVNQSGGNFRLQTNSPCINAGNNAYVAGNTDLDGRPRIVGGTVDVGAYEFQGPGMGEFIGWLRQFGLPTDGSADYADSDGDGMNNWQEWRAGTNPTNAASVLEMYSPTNIPSGLSVSWQSVNTRTYYLQRSTNPLAQPAFSTIQSNLTGQAGTTFYTDTNAPTPGPAYYRVGVQ